MTPSRQERHCSTSSSSSSSSPTTATSTDSETREREDRSEIDFSPVPVSSSNVDDRTVKPVVCRESNHEQGRQANQKHPKTNKKETMIERGHPLFADSSRASSEIPEWLQEFRENLVDDEVPEHRDSHASSSHEVSLEPTSKRREDLGKHSVYTHFPKDQNCEICKRTNITNAPCRRRNGGAVLRAEKFGDFITADHKVLSDNCESRNNHRYAVVVQDLATQWIQAYPCKTKTSQETQRSLQKFLEPDRNPKVIYTDNSMEIGKACEDLSWNHCTSTPHRSETNGIAERAVRRVKEGTSAVLLQSGLEESWWADSMECYTYLRNVTDLLSDGKTPIWKTFWATIYRTDYSIWFTGWVSSYNCERPVKIPSVWQESLTWIVPRIRIKRGGNLERWRSGCRPWGVGDDGRIGNLLKKTQCERGHICKRKGEFNFPIADGRIKLLGGDQDLRTSTLIRDRPIRGESHVDFLGESEGSLPTSRLVSWCRWSDKWLLAMSGNFIYRHHVEPRVTEVHWRLQNYSPEFGCQARETHRWLLEYRWVKRFVWSMDRFHSIYSIARKTSKRIYVVRGEINEKTADIQARSFMARTLGENGKECQAEGEAKMVQWKTKTR